MEGMEALKMATYRNGKPIIIKRETSQEIIKMRRDLARYALRKVAEQWLKELR
jgi:hypothetical protein